jgi:hypothetical protein
MGNPFDDFKNSVSNTVQSVGNYVGQVAQNPITYLSGNPTTGSVATSLGIGTPPPQPNVPGVDPNVSALQGEQVQQAADFNKNLPGLKQQMAEGLTQQSNQLVAQNKDALNHRNAGRGLLYGGINAGEEGAMRANAATNLTGQITSANAGLDELGTTLSSEAVQTGVNIQQDAQAQQDQIYQQAMASLSANNQLYSGIAGTGLLATMLAL